jgi:superfamily II DNA or RNA helicase
MAEQSHLEALKDQRVRLPGHFEGVVTVEAVRALGAGYEVRVRRASGALEETVLSATEFDALLRSVEQITPSSTTSRLADPSQLALLIESARIRLAYAYDTQFAVSLSGIRTLPHQIEAVYQKMLPQPRLRFLLADDPGAGKTVMAGLLIKEMKLRQAVERVLIVAPAPLTIQWQDELLRFFGEAFQIIGAANDQAQLIDLWGRERQVITSIDYAKQEQVRERIWQQQWDLVVIDEAHKCSAYTRRRTDRADDAEKTRRYQFAEKITERADHVLLMTATPHHGDDDRFGHFLRLVDPDLFPEPHRLAAEAGQIRRQVLRLGRDCPWALRRLKEDLRDLNGRRLFPDRHAETVTFHLNAAEYALYKSVTAYINAFLPQAGRTDGRKRASVALARTVLQRRLASSTHAIYESLKRRLARQNKLLDELETLPPAQRARFLDRLRQRLTDDELDEDDLDEAARDDLTDEFTAAQELDQLRAEVAAQTQAIRDRADDSKLAALRACLTRAQFDELKDGRGKLLIFTEHRDTLNYLIESLKRWGYTTVAIHGGMNPRERKTAQETFRTQAQVCVATEAAGEGINLQFCHLLINYDLPWNPARLEQRLGRIHRIGQERDVYVFNFVAEESENGDPIIEGSILKRLLDKLDLMRSALGGDRVFDVIGEVLSINDINLPEILREAAYDPRRLDEYLDQIDRIDPRRLREYEEATGIALARAYVDFSAFQQANFENEERRLMPEYVARQFLAAAERVGLRVTPRADGMWRIEHVPHDLRSERLESVRRLGSAETAYTKVTFHKQVLERDQHADAVLLGPGHPLYAAVDEKLNQQLAELTGGTALFTDATAAAPYRLHFLEYEIRGEASAASRHPNVAPTVHAELVAVREDVEGGLALVPADSLHDLAPVDGEQFARLRANAPASGEAALLPPVDASTATDFVKSGYQLEKRLQVQAERQSFAQIIRDYLARSFDARIGDAERRVMALRAREAQGETEVALARQRAESDLAELQRARRERLNGLERLTIARNGPVRHLATLLVTPITMLRSEASPDADDAEQTPFARGRANFSDLSAARQKEIELAAMRIVIEYERARGWEPVDISHIHGPGFDIRSFGPADPGSGVRPARRIEVKGRQRGQPILLTRNEWLKARQLGESYWLYVVWNPLEPDASPVIIQNPGQRLDHVAREVREISHWEISAQAIDVLS